MRKPLSPVEIVHLLAEVGAYGVNFHDNDLVPIDATPPSATRSSRTSSRPWQETGLVVPMATTNLFTDPVFKDGAFTSNDPKVRAYALQKTMHAIDLGVELGAKIYVFWGGREGIETDAAKDPADGHQALPRGDELPVRVRPRPGLRSEVRPGSQAQRAARRHLHRHHRRTCWPSSRRWTTPRWWASTRKWRTSTWPGLNFMHGVAQAWDAGKLFHIDLNDQNFGRYDQDFRFGAAI